MSVKVFASSMVPRRPKAGHDRRRQLRRVGERLVCSPAVSCVRHAAHLLPHREVNLHFEPRALSSHALRARTRCRTTTAWRRWGGRESCEAGAAECPVQELRGHHRASQPAAPPLAGATVYTRARTHTHAAPPPAGATVSTQRAAAALRTNIAAQRRSDARNGRLLFINSAASTRGFAPVHIGACLTCCAVVGEEGGGGWGRTGSVVSNLY